VDSTGISLAVRPRADTLHSSNIFEVIMGFLNENLCTLRVDIAMVCEKLVST
jgi:hypothetical protein